MALNPSATAALRSTPGYVPPPKPPPLPPLPPLTLAPLPPPPAGDFGAAGRPNASHEAFLQGQWANLPAKYKPQFQLAKEQAAHDLAPLGGWEFQQDDPSTPQDESLNLVATGKEGQAHRDAYRSVRGAQAARGALYSSFTDTALGAAYTRISEAARGVVNQHAATMARINQTEQSESDAIIEGLISDYGPDAMWLKDNPPPTPAPAPTTPAASHPAGLFTWPQWVAYQKQHHRPAGQITPANFHAYIAAHTAAAAPIGNMGTSTQHVAPTRPPVHVAPQRPPAIHVHVNTSPRGR